MKVSAKLNNFRMPNRKVKLVADLMIGMDVADALNQLNATAKKTAPFLITLLDSAIANGENNFGINKDNMYIFDVVVKEGITLKRWMPKAYGRATPIRRRSSHIEIVLEERFEGKDRKTKEQLEKEKKARLDARKKLEKDSIDKQEKETKAVEKNEVKSKDARTETKASDKGWAKKMFNRKAGM